MFTSAALRASQRIPRLRPLFRSTTNKSLITTSIPRRTLFDRYKSPEIPEPYYSTHTRPPPPPGEWITPRFGSPYFRGNTPQQTKMIAQAREMGLYDGRENPTSFKEDPWFTWPIPWTLVRVSLFGFWCYLASEIFGSRISAKYDNTVYWFAHQKDVIKAKLQKKEKKEDEQPAVDGAEAVEAATPAEKPAH